MALTKNSFDEYLAARQELLTDRELSVSADSDSPSRTSLIKRNHRRLENTYRKAIPYVIVLFLAAFALGLLFWILSAIGHSKQGLHECPELKLETPYNTVLFENAKRLDRESRELQSHFDSERILSDIRYLAQGMHVAGTRDNQHVMRWLGDQYTMMGMKVKLYNYTVLLNYPDYSRPNSVDIQEEYTGKWRTLSDGLSRQLGDETQRMQQLDRRGLVWWSAYSGNGTVEGRIVYANYGYKEDFDKLEERGIILKGVIIMVRLGGLSRAEKVREAEKRGASGVILFNDPIHYTTVDRNRTFPFDVWMPGTGAQRGTLLSTVGDPETPGIPSKQYAHRSESEHSAKKKGIIPHIPVIPIGYNDALRIMHSLNGMNVQDPTWRGGLDTPYRYTGSRTYRLAVRSKSVRRTITNVVATIRGSEEPDRWIIVGNHADAWVYGAVDPVSGTSVQLEMARAFTKMPQPKRTLVFCHWDAEEFGLIGSTEFVEEMSNVLGARAVAYLNVDHISGNLTLDVKAVPLLYRVISDAAKKIPQTNEIEIEAGRVTLDATWRKYRPAAGPIRGDRSIPDIGPPTAGSDYQRFIAYLGIPSADFKMETAPDQSYPLYHTMYEIPWLVENLLDPHGAAMKSVGQLWAETTHRLANSRIIPLNVLDYANALSTMLIKTKSQLEQAEIYKDIPERLSYALDNLEESLGRLHLIAKAIEVLVSDVSMGMRGLPFSKLEQLNSRLLLVDRAFLEPHFHASPLHQHLLFSPFKTNTGAFGIVMDSALQYDSSHGEKRPKAIENTLLSITRLQFAIEKVINLLDINTHGF